MFSVAQRSFAAFRAAHLLLIRRRSEQVSGVHFILTVNYCKCDNTFSCKCRHVDNGKIDFLTSRKCAKLKRVLADWPDL